MGYSKEELTKMITDIICDETGYSESKIIPTSLLEDELDIDSLSILTIFVTIQDEINVPIPEEDWYPLTTVEKIVEYILINQEA